MRSQMCGRQCWVAVAVLFATGAVCQEQVMRNATRLSKQLLHEYSRNILPTPDGGLEVELSLALGQFVSISTALETLEFQGWWRMYWTDPRLSWDASVWGVETLSFELMQVWVPDLTVYEQISDLLSPSVVTCYSSGDCQTSIPRKTKIGCVMNIGAFPYDSQKCNFTIGSWSYDGTRLDLVPRRFAAISDVLQDGALPERIPVDLEPYKGFQEFSLVAVKTIWKNDLYNCCPEPYPIFLIEFDLQRSTQTYIGGMIAPLLLVTFIGFFSLLMPAPPSGARPALSVTIMLTTATVYFVASRSTPQSNQSTIIGRMYVAALGCSFLLVFVSIVTTALNLIHAEDPSQTKHLVEFFTHFDKNGNGKLDREEFQKALTELGVEEDEQEKMMKFFMTEDDPTINLDQWKAFSSLTQKNDDAAVYHNSLVQRLVRMNIEKKLKTSGKYIGRDHPTVLKLALRDERKAASKASTERDKRNAAELTSSAPVTQVASDLRAQLAFQSVPPGHPWSVPPYMSAGAFPPNSTTAWGSGVSFGGADWQPPRHQIGRGGKKPADDDSRSWDAASGVEYNMDHDLDLMRSPSFLNRSRTREAILFNTSETLGQVTRKVSRLLNGHTVVQNNPQRVGRELSAKVDKWARLVLPFFFVLYLALEYAGAFSGEAVAGDMHKDSDGITKTRVEFYDYRTNGPDQGTCFRNFPKTKTSRNLFRAAEDDCDQ